MRLWLARVGLLASVALGACSGSGSATVATEPETVTAEEGAAESRVQRFTGNGNKTIRVRLQNGSTLHWTNDGEYFAVSDLEEFKWDGVNSDERQGDSFIPAGRYELTVSAVGNWTITITDDAFSE